MQNSLERIKEILESDAGFNLAKDHLIDNRFEFIKRAVSSIENKDESFYTELIGLISRYFDQLYDGEVERIPAIVYDKKGKVVRQEYYDDALNSGDLHELRTANRDLSKALHSYICDILRSNPNIKLDIDVLKRLLDRNPQQFTLSVEEDYLFRLFDFEALAKIIDRNQTLKISGIGIDDIYQLLIDTCQINNADVFGILVKPADFQENRKKIDDFLTWCNAKTFVQVTKIIRKYFDKDFDCFTIVSGRTKNHFREVAIIELLKSSPEENDYIFIHRLLTESVVPIDYDFAWGDYGGQTSLKACIAFSGDRRLIRDLLSIDTNRQSCYWHGDAKIQLYRLYAILGEYEMALAIFNEDYDITYDFTEKFNKSGCAFGSFMYQDSLVAFLQSICSSFAEEDVEYSKQRDIIYKLLNNGNIKHINLKEVVPILQAVLTPLDFDLLSDSLRKKYESHEVAFIEVAETDYHYDRYAIRIVSDENVPAYLGALNNKEGNKTLDFAPVENGDSKE